MDAVTVTTVATCVAALAAVFGVAHAVQQQREGHRRALLHERLTEATALLAAFEQVDAAKRVEAWQAEHEPPSRPSPEGDRAAAEFAAHVQASAEDLPIIKGSVFAHWPFGTVDPQEKAYLATAPKVGDPEQDDDLTMQMRAELVGVVRALRALLNANRVTGRMVKRSLQPKFRPSEAGDAQKPELCWNPNDQEG